MTTIGGSRRSSALRSTKRVCGSGPSEASTSSMTPSTIDSVRSTSPPKSAWPGVSTMLIRWSVVVDGGVLRQDRDAALALELVRVHHALGDPLVGAEDAALVQQRVDQRRLAVVDVGDDGDVAPSGLAISCGLTGSKASHQYTGECQFTSNSYPPGATSRRPWLVKKRLDGESTLAPRNCRVRTFSPVSL